jgi:hypothetical protein
MMRVSFILFMITLNLSAQNPFASASFFSSNHPISYTLPYSWPIYFVADQTITVVAVDSSCVFFQSTDANTQEYFELLPGQVKRFKILSSIPTFSSPLTYRGFSVHSTGKVNVFSSINEHATSDSCSNHPGELLSDAGGMSHVPGGRFTNIFIAPPPSSDSVAGNTPWFVTIKSHFDNNHVLIKPRSAIILDLLNVIPFWPSNGTYDTVLNKNQCFQFVLDNARAFNDSTRPRPNGSVFTSANNLPFDVIITQLHGVHYDCTSKNLLIHPTIRGLVTRRYFTPQLSIENTDTIFHLPRYLSGCREEQYDFTSLRDSNRIFVNGILTRILDSNEIFRFRLTSPSVITSDFGLQGGVCVVYDSAITNSIYGGWSAIAQGDRFSVRRSQFSTLRNWDTSMRHFALVNIPVSDTATFRHNGLKPTAQFATYPSDNKWGYYKIALDTGVHVLSSDKGFYGMYYNYRVASDAPADTFNYNFVNSKEVGNYNQNFPLPESVPSRTTDLAFSVWSQGQQLLNKPNDTIDLCLSSSLQIQTGTQWDNQWSVTFGDGTDTVVRTFGMPYRLNHSYTELGIYKVSLQQGHFCDTLETSFFVHVIEAAKADFQIDTSWACDFVELQLTTTANSASEWSWDVNGQQSTQPSMRIRLPYRDTTILITHVSYLGYCQDSTQRSLTFEMGSDTLIGLGNIVTPNADGINDKICLPEEIRIGSDPCFNWQIFNRWGTPVYQTDQPIDCWEPERSVASGVYYSIINVQGRLYRSTVTLTR